MKHGKEPGALLPVCAALWLAAAAVFLPLWLVFGQ